MPIVPASDGPSIGPQPLGPSRSEHYDAQVQDSGVHAVAAGVDAAGDALGEDFLRHKEAADQIAVQEADVKAAHLTTALLYDPQTGALNRRGKDAFTIPGEVMPKLDKGFNDISGTLTNDTQRRAFAGVVAQRKQHVDQVVQQHVSGEIRRWDQETTQGVIDAAKNDAVVNYTNPQIVYESIGKLIDAIGASGKRNGVPVEATNAAIRDAESDTRTAVIGRMIDTQQTDDARYYYGQWKERIDGQHQAVIDRALKVADRKDESRKVADDVVMAPTKDGEPQDLLGALQELDGRKIGNTDVYDEAKQRIVQHFDLQRRAEMQRQGDLYDQAVAALDDPNNAKGIDGVPSSVIAGLDGKARRSFEAYAATRANREEPKTNWTAYESILGQAADEQSRPDFLERRLTLDSDKLAPAQLHSLLDMQARMREESSKDQAKLDYTRGVESNKRIVDDLLKSAGVLKAKPSDMTEGDNTRVAGFRDQLDRALVTEQRNTGKTATPAQVRTTAAKLLADTQWESARNVTNLFGAGFWKEWFDPWAAPTDTTTGKAFEAPGARDIAYGVDDVPPAEVAEIIGEFRKQGVAVPDPRDRAASRAFQERVVDEYNKQVVKTARDKARKGE